MSGDTFSFSIDVERDPQSDDFHGIWDVVENGTWLNIAGKGSGERSDTGMSGTFAGLFAFYGLGLPGTGQYCSASDHSFRFMKQ